MKIYQDTFYEVGEIHGFYRLADVFSLKEDAVAKMKEINEKEEPTVYAVFKCVFEVVHDEEENLFRKTSTTTREEIKDDT